MLYKVIAVFLIAVELLAAFRPQAIAQQPEPARLPDEYTLKAVFLYSFGRYVEWPQGTFASASDPFVIGVLGEDSIVGALDEIAAKKTIQQRRIVVQRFASLAEVRQPCHILFVSHSVTAEQQAAVLRQLDGKPVFVVGETPGFAEKGGTANFFIDGERVGFEINVNSARRAQLRMEAKLLSLGKSVGNPQSTSAN